MKDYFTMEKLVMRIRFAPSTGCPFGQFVVEAESQEDRALLACFLSAPYAEWKFHQHGVGYMGGLDGPTNFNFGWISHESIAKYKSERTAGYRFIKWLKRLSRYRITVSATEPR